MKWRLDRWKDLPRHVSRERIPQTIKACLEQDADPWCVACSGGSDSVFLLLLMRCFWPQHPCVLLHFNHRVRSVSDHEEQCLRQLAEQLQIPIEVGYRKRSSLHPGTFAQTMCMAVTEATPNGLRSADHSPEVQEFDGRRRGHLVSDASAASVASHERTNVFDNQSAGPMDASAAEKPVQKYSEAALRAERYAFFERMLQRHRSHILLLGHHQDDQLETVFMRLMRGVSLEGLIAPRAIHRVSFASTNDFYTKVRPLLGFQKQEIQTICRSCGIAFFEDHTNDQDDCMRNRIRHHLLPQFHSVFEGCHWRTGFTRSVQWLSEQRDYLHQHLSQKFAAWDFSASALDRTALQALPMLEGRHVLQRWLLAHGVTEIRSYTLDQCLRAFAAQSSGHLSVNAHLQMQWNRQQVQLVAIHRTPCPNVYVKFHTGTIFFPHHARLSLKVEPLTDALYTAIIHGTFSHQTTAVVDLERSGTLWIVRTWLPGDRYRPLGALHAKKVKHLFNDRKIPCMQKHWLPVVCSGDDQRIVWIPGLPPCDAYKITPQTKFCVFLIYQTA